MQAHGGSSDLEMAVTLGRYIVYISYRRCVYNYCYYHSLSVRTKQLRFKEMRWGIP